MKDTFLNVAESHVGVLRRPRMLPTVIFSTRSAEYAENILSNRHATMRTSTQGRRDIGELQTALQTLMDAERFLCGLGIVTPTEESESG